MSATLGHLNIQLTLEQAKFQRGLDNAQRKAKQFSERTIQYLNNIEKAANSTNKAIRFQFQEDILKFSKNALQQTIQLADSYTELTNRLRLVTNSQTEFANATQSVFDIALKTNQAVGATAEIYQRFAKKK